MSQQWLSLLPYASSGGDSSIPWCRNLEIDEHFVSQSCRNTPSQTLVPVAVSAGGGRGLSRMLSSSLDVLESSQTCSCVASWACALLDIITECRIKIFRFLWALHGIIGNTEKKVLEISYSLFRQVCRLPELCTPVTDGADSGRYSLR